MAMVDVNGSSHGFNSISLASRHLQMMITDNKSGGDEFNSSCSNGDVEVKEHCKIMVEENPENPSFLGNYA
ncbi:hypothetical protein V6N13_141058 [Hibiscus sabdariffa]|uniref:Uncharacterized protein n=1 Tax=Hibiscus sabdariffa TaxID=183260 RepID=A0ABR2Q135_9ROSI